ncbi:MAG TPA: polysaccharide biosynthesis C-terminal domain-containing protein [Acidimicrobiales bacterium]|nr:polysaccharide biosynthesis C-terminal domain-containing protein [Acidimicrobiales bacterium]
MLTEAAAPSFGRAARAAGVLTAGRQIGALLLTAGVLALPHYLRARDLDPFLWAYFGQLLISSVLNFGLERYTAREVAGDPTPAAILGAAVKGRLWTAAVTPLALAVFFAAVHVHLGAVAWIGVTVWTLAVQFEGVCFAALRAADRAATEAGVSLVGRVVQTAGLLVVAAQGGSIAALLAVAAGSEAIVAFAAAVAARRAVGVSWRGTLPLRKLAVYSVLELSVFAYLRADLIIVGRLLGSSQGATYGLGYRLVDALIALATPALLVLFAYASGQSARGEALEDTRRRTQMLLPSLGVVFAAVGIAGVGALTHVLPRLDAVGPALRVLLATVPLTYLIGVESHLLSAEDHNRPVVITGAVALVVNVALNVVLVRHFGMVGAAAALVVTESLQVIGLSLGHRDARHGAERLAPLVALLVVGAVACNVGQLAVGCVLVAVAVGVALMTMRRAVHA